MMERHACLGLALMLALPSQFVMADDTRGVPQFTPAQASNEFIPPKPKEGFRYPDCFCTDSTGKRVDVGRMACLTIGSESFTAKCSKSLNNTIWRRVSEGCPSV